jgi:hypothetical protein
LATISVQLADWNWRLEVRGVPPTIVPWKKGGSPAEIR